MSAWELKYAFKIVGILINIQGIRSPLSILFLIKIKSGTTTQIKHGKLLSEFGHLEIDTVIEEKTKTNTDCVPLTIVEWQIRHALVRKITSKTKDAIMNELNNIRSFFGERFDQVGYNGFESADLAKLETETSTLVYS